MPASNIGVFLVVTITYTTLGLLYPLALWNKLRLEPADRRRWLKSTPTFLLYLPFLFSLAAGILFSAFPWQEVLAWQVGEKAIGGGILAILLFLAIFAARADLSRPMVEPFMFKDMKEPLRIEKEIREKLRKRDRNDTIMLHLAKYRSIAPALKTFTGLQNRGSSCAWASFLLNLLAAVTIGFLFWYLAMSAWLKLSIDKSSLAAAIGLFCLWFPLRLYAEWYLHFYSLARLPTYFAFWFILVASILAYGFLAYNTGGIGEALSLGVAALLAVIGIVGKVKPEWLGGLARGIENVTLEWYLAINTLIVIAFISMVAGMFNA